ncbi:hypothetical protein GCM10009736_12530 [Actinomadura bangladeshensis]
MLRPGPAARCTLGTTAARGLTSFRGADAPAPLTRPATGAPDSKRVLDTAPETAAARCTASLAAGSGLRRTAGWIGEPTGPAARSADPATPRLQRVTGWIGGPTRTGDAPTPPEPTSAAR